MNPNLFSSSTESRKHREKRSAAKFQAGMPYMTACVGLCAAFAAEAEKLPQRLYQSPLTRFCGALREAEIPCAKSAGFHDPSQRPDFPGKLRATQRSETKQEKALTLYAPGRSLPPAVRAVFSGLRMALFSPAPSPDDAFPSGNHDFSHWKGVLPDASRFSGHANDNIPIILPRRPGYSPALPVCCVVGRRRWTQSVRICAA